MTMDLLPLIKKVLAIAEYDRPVNFINIKLRPVFEVNTIIGLRYVSFKGFMIITKNGTLQKKLRAAEMA